jgi:hypothetical protein
MHSQLARFHEVTPDVDVDERALRAAQLKSIIDCDCLTLDYDRLTEFDCDCLSV